MKSKFQHSTLFQFPWLKKFTSACKKIECDPNFQPSITNKELFALVVDENGNAKHIPRRNALAIQPMDLIPKSKDGDSLGVLYQIKIAKKGYVDDDFPVWHIDDSVVIFVNKNSEISIHCSEKAKNGDLSSPLTHLSVDKFLNCSCLHYPEEKKYSF